MLPVLLGLKIQILYFERLFFNGRSTKVELSEMMQGIFLFQIILGTQTNCACDERHNLCMFEGHLS